MIREFREFIARGSVVDLAVGVVIGAAFGKIVDSLVKDVLMPPIGWMMGGMDFSNLFVTLGPGEFATLEEAKTAGAATINYGVFLNAVIQFLVVAFAVFLVIRQYNRLRRKNDPAPAAPTEEACPHCLFKIPIGARRCGHCAADIAR
jgi:large conductance mechanosensitive channel